MNVISMMEYGHKTVLDAIQDLPLDRWNVSGVCGLWSVKDIVAHLVSYEHMFEDVVGVTLDATRKTPTLEAMLSTGDKFNDIQVEPYKSQSSDAVLAAYQKGWEDTLWHKDGLIPWYGDYTLAELMVYSIYGHKREHSAQIALYHDTIKAQS